MFWLVGKEYQIGFTEAGFYTQREIGWVGFIHPHLNNVNSLVRLGTSIIF